ncbi:MAG: multidrug effflux MFS transporter [Candidatus Berkiella sp.]
MTQSNHTMFRFIALLTPMVLLMGLALDLYIPSQQIMMHALDLNFPQIQWTMTIYMYCFGLGQLIVGPITDRFGRRIPLFLSILLYIAGSVLTASVDQYLHILIGRSLEAFGACGAMVIALALVRDKYEGNNAIKAFTYLRSMSTLAPILAPSLGVFLALHYGWRADFYFLAFLGGLALACGFGIEYPPHTVAVSKANNFLRTYWHIFKNASFRHYAVCAAMVQTVMFSYFSISPVIYLQHLQLSEAYFAILFSVNASAFLLAAFIFASLIAKLGIKKSVFIGALLYISAGILVWMMQCYFGMRIETLLIPGMLASAGCAFALGPSCTGALKPFKEQSGKAAALLGCIEFMLGGMLGACVVYIPPVSVFPFAISLIATGSIIFLNLALERSQN